MALERIIFARTPKDGTAFAAPSAFLTRRASPVVLRDEFLGAPETLSPYCLDADAGTVTFVRTERGVDLAEVHPFFYEAQRRFAKSTITASFDEVIALGDDLESLKSRVAFLYSAGRSGSTVAGRVANALPGVQSISEPDIYACATMQRIPGDAARDALLVKVLRATTRLLAAHRARVVPACPTLLVKQRGMGVFGAPLFAAALPTSRALYLDREPTAVVDSYVGAFLGHPVVRLARRLGLDRLGVAVLRFGARFTHPWIPNHMPEVIADSKGDDAAELLARSVVSMNEAARRYAATGLVRFHAFLRYEDLETSPIGFARSLATGLDLPPSPSLTSALLSIDEVVAVDAQAGSTVASRKTRSLSHEDALRIERIARTSRSQSLGSTEAVA